VGQNSPVPQRPKSGATKVESFRRPGALGARAPTISSMCRDAVVTVRVTVGGLVGKGAGRKNGLAPCRARAQKALSITILAALPAPSVAPVHGSTMFLQPRRTCIERVPGTAAHRAPGPAASRAVDQAARLRRRSTTTLRGPAPLRLICAVWKMPRQSVASPIGAVRKAQALVAIFVGKDRVSRQGIRSRPDATRLNGRWCR